MNFELKSLTLAGACAHKCDLLVQLVPEAFKPQGDAVSRLVQQALQAGDLEIRPGRLLEVYAPEGVAARRVALLGCGQGDAKSVRQAVQALAPALRAAGVKRVAVVLAGAPAGAALAAAVRTLAEVCYTYTTTKPKAQVCGVSRITLAVADVKSLQADFDVAVALAAGVELAREWANRPGNHATPTLLGNAAKALAKHPWLRCKLHGPQEVAKLGMGAFAAVAQGSKEPLRLIELHYEGAAKAQAPVVLVGKGITFDSGGISLKPGAEMDEMKYDMGGAASVLGVFRALAELQPAINVVGIVPSCENMPDGCAVKPGDVVTGMSGQTIEILNTDAEGRLVLSDALTYAARFRPAAVIDIATLTGACVVALGGVHSGLFSSDDELARQLQAAGDAALDSCWRMPLDDDYADGLKSNFADVANIAGRAAGAVTAAKFLQRFAGDAAWAHLDIAGTAWKSGAAKGATGRPVGLLLHYLLARAAHPVAAAPRKPARRSRAA